MGTEFVQQRVPAELRPLAADDVEKRFKLRLAHLQNATRESAAEHIVAGNVALNVAQAPLDLPEQQLTKMFDEADLCNSEVELREWRQKNSLAYQGKHRSALSDPCVGRHADAI